MWSDSRLDPARGPLWTQIAGLLRGAIEAGEFPPGATLPAEAEINAAFGVSRTTTRAAMQQLVSEGLVSRHPGQGTLVLDRRVDPPLDTIRSFSEDMQSRGMTASYRVLECGWREASTEASLALDLPTRDRPFHLTRLLLANGRVVGVSSSFIRPDIFGDAAPPDAGTLASGSLYGWLRAELGVTISGGIEFVEASLAGAAMAPLLGIGAEQPVLVARRTAHDAGRRAIEFATITYRADRYRFRIDL